MAAKIEKGDETTLNMTPMIDMTFLLVIFFMLTLDMTTKEFIPVQLPEAKKGEEIPKETNPEEPVFVVNLRHNGEAVIKGVPYDMASTDPAKQAEALQALSDGLAALSDDPKFKNEDGSSKVMVMIHADRAAQWRYAQWIMQQASKPRLKIYKIRFAVKRPPEPE